MFPWFDSNSINHSNTHGLALVTMNINPLFRFEVFPTKSCTCTFRLYTPEGSDPSVFAVVLVPGPGIDGLLNILLL